MMSVNLEIPIVVLFALWRNERGEERVSNERPGEKNEPGEVEMKKEREEREKGGATMGRR